MGTTGAVAPGVGLEVGLLGWALMTSLGRVSLVGDHGRDWGQVLVIGKWDWGQGLATDERALMTDW